MLGPLLFLIFIIDMSKLQLKGRLYLFADDSSLVYSEKTEDELKTSIESDFKTISNYMKVNKIQLNVIKTNIMKFSNINYNHNFEVSLNGTIMTSVHKVKCLGLILNSNLNLDAHIKEIESKLAKGVGILRKFRTKFDVTTKLLIYAALVGVTICN